MVFMGIGAVCFGQWPGQDILTRKLSAETAWDLFVAADRFRLEQLRDTALHTILRRGEDAENVSFFPKQCGHTVWVLTVREKQLFGVSCRDHLWKRGVRCFLFFPCSWVKFLVNMCVFFPRFPGTTLRFW